MSLMKLLLGCLGALMILGAGFYIVYYLALGGLWAAFISGVMGIGIRSLAVIFGIPIVLLVGGGILVYKGFFSY